MQDLDKIRSELATYTQAITLSLNLVGLGSQGKVERYMESHGDELREIKTSLNWLTAKFQVREGSTYGEKSILSSYNGDDKEVWKMFRRELIHDGFSSRTLSRHKETIKNYVMELGERGVLDDGVPEEVLEDDANEVVVKNAVVNRDNVSSQVTGLKERSISTGLGQLEEGTEVGRDHNTMIYPENPVPRQPTLNTTQAEDHLSTTTGPLEQESDSGNGGGSEDAEEENYTGSENETASGIHDQVFTELKPTVNEETPSPTTTAAHKLQAIGTEVVDDDGDIEYLETRRVRRL
jgi:hypothetical protein